MVHRLLIHSFLINAVWVGSIVSYKISIEIWSFLESIEVGSIILDGNLTFCMQRVRLLRLKMQKYWNL